MSTHSQPVTLDPLTGQFRLGELPQIAPWIFEEIDALGVEDVLAQVLELGFSTDEPLTMTIWVKAISRCHSEMWNGVFGGG